MGFLTGKKLLITGVISNRSIAYGVAKACRAQGADLAFSYVGERFKDRITDFAAEFDVQGLELDWAFVIWDADFRESHGDWDHCSFVRDRQQRIQ